MQIRRLRLVNFRQHEDTDLAFDRGLIGIVGPNGAGKTSLLEAISFALYGTSGTRGTRSTLRRRNAPPRARFEVQLDFTLGTHQYSVTRSLTMADLRQDGEIIANSGTAVTQRVVELLGMTRDEFFNTYFTGQKELAVMAAMGRTERAQFLSRVIGYDRLRDAQERLRQERSSVKSQQAGIEQGLADPDAIEADLTQAVASLEQARTVRTTALATEQEVRERLAGLTPRWTAAQQRRTTWQSLDGERRLVDKRVAVAREQFRTLDQQLAQAIHARERLSQVQPQIDEYARLCTEREALDAAALAYAHRSRGVARRDQAQRRLGALATQLTTLAVGPSTDTLIAARTVVLAHRQVGEEQITERRTRWTQDGQEARTKLDGLRERYREIKEQRERIEEQGPEGICPTCGRPLGKDYPAMVALLGRQMDEVETDGKYFSARVAQLGDEPAGVGELVAEQAQLDRELRRLTESLGQAQAHNRQRKELTTEQMTLRDELAVLDHDLAGPAGEYDAARHEQVRNRVAELEPSRREYDQLTGMAHRAESLVADAALAEQRASVAEAELAALDERIAGLAWDPAMFDTLETAVREGEGALQSALFAVQAGADQLERAERDRQLALARRADRASKADVSRQLGADIALLDELDRAFSELRTQLNLELRPDLSERASGFLADLTASRYTDLELDEDYVASVIEDGEAKPIISGGEEDVVNLALRLAISQLIAERAGQPLSLLVLDEVFGSLDEERRNAVLALLRALADRFPQVIVITHVDGMQDAFDRLLRVSYRVETGVSVVRDDTPEPLDVAV